MEIKLIDFGLDERFKPRRAYSNDAGLDIYSPINKIIEPGVTKKIGLKFGLEIPDGHMGLIFPRSSYASQSLITHLPPIDSRYRGEIYILVYNATNNTVIEIEEGDRIGQLIILPVIIPTLVNSFKERGNEGFGSSGK